MKIARFILPGLLAGVAVGWLWPMDSIARMEVNGNAAAKNVVRAREAGNEELPRLPVRMDTDQVWLSKDKLKDALRLGNSTLLKMSVFRKIENGRITSSAFDSICSCLGMSPEESRDFHRILSEAAESRLKWEKANVKGIQTGPAEWEIRVPGDRGTAVEALREKLEERFGAERLGEIDLLADLDGFFQTDYFLPEFRHGVMKVCSRLGDELVNEQRVVELKVETSERTVDCRFNNASLDQIEFQERYAGYIGGADAIREAARHLAD